MYILEFISIWMSHASSGQNHMRLGAIVLNSTLLEQTLSSPIHCRPSVKRRIVGAKMPYKIWKRLDCDEISVRECCDSTAPSY